MSGVLRFLALAGAVAVVGYARSLYVWDHAHDHRAGAR